MHLRLRTKPSGSQHVRTQVFMGVDAEHLANCGELCFRPKEWKLFQASLLLGCEQIEVSMDSFGSEVNQCLG